MENSADLGELVAPLAGVAACGYLLGALPFGYLVARAHGVNIFEVGSRNPGATNVRRVLGRGPGNTVFALDAAKGALAAGWPLLLALGGVAASGPGPLRTLAACAGWLAYVGLAFALLGHSFSCFTRFRGGKGVATAAGGILVLMPLAAAVVAVVWVATFYASRYVSLASILGALCLPLAVLLLKHDAASLGVSAAVAVFVVVRHRSNISRLLAGTEARFERKKDKEPAP